MRHRLQVLDYGLSLVADTVTYWILAFARMTARRGRRPLICRLDPPDTEGDSYWLQYPQELEAFVRSRLSAMKAGSVDKRES